MRSDGQKSVRDYFTSGNSSFQSGRGSLSSPSSSKRTLSDDESEPVSSTPAKKKLPASKPVIVIDSDIDEDEENIFQQSTKFKNSNSVHSPSDKCIFQPWSGPKLASETHRKKTTHSRPGKWSCAVCTYINHPLISYCEMCFTKKDTQQSQPPCSLADSSALVHSDPVTSSLSAVYTSVPSSHKEVLELASCQQNPDIYISSLLQENPMQLQSYFLESNTDKVLPISHVNDSSNCLQTNSDVCNTSLLNTLSIDSERPSDAECASNSDADIYRVGDITAESSSELNVDFSTTTVHELFQFCCSRNSSRIYVYDKVFLVSNRPSLLYAVYDIIT